MKHVLSALIVCSLLISSSVFANTLPPHFAGLGVFTFKGTVEPSKSAKAAKAYAKEVSEHDITFVIVKSHDGDSWGTRIGKGWEPAISKELVDAFHAKNIRVYSYFTARFRHKNSVSGSVKLALDTLSMGVDGIVVDDLGWLGGTTKQWEALFVELRKEVDKRKDTVLAFSSFPHFVQWEKSPWHIALKYSQYFLPQEYWGLFKAGKGKMEPQNALAYGQSQFDILKTKHPEYANCELIPIGMTYGKHVNEKQIKKFMEAALPYYHVGLFTYEEMSSSEWGAVADIAKKYDPYRKRQRISAFDQINHPTKTEPKPSKEPKRGAKKSAEKKSPQPLPESKSRKRCGVCP